MPETDELRAVHLRIVLSLIDAATATSEAGDFWNNDGEREAAFRHIDEALITAAALGAVAAQARLEAFKGKNQHDDALLACAARHASAIGDRRLEADIARQRAGHFGNMGRFDEFAGPCRPSHRAVRKSRRARRVGLRHGVLWPMLPGARRQAPGSSPIGGAGALHRRGDPRSEAPLMAGHGVRGPNVQGRVAGDHPGRPRTPAVRMECRQLGRGSLVVRIRYCCRGQARQSRSSGRTYREGARSKPLLLRGTTFPGFYPQIALGQLRLAPGGGSAWRWPRPSRPCATPSARCCRSSSSAPRIACWAEPLRQWAATHEAVRRFEESLSISGSESDPARSSDRA